MKRILYTNLVLLFCLRAGAQSLTPSVYTPPVTGFRQLQQENPYIIEQTSENGNWNNYYKYTWAPSPVSGYNAFTATHFWNNENWKVQNLSSDSFILNADGSIAKAFETVEYNYNDIYVGKTKFKYTYTYDASKRISVFQCDRTPTATSNTYQAYFITRMSYDNSGNRISDSTTYYAPSSSFNSSYVYDNNNKLTAFFNIDLPSGDTVYRAFYSYENNNIKSMYGEALDRNLGAWLPQSIDSFTYQNNKIVRNLRYGLISFNQAPPTFQPINDDTYTYNTDGTLSTTNQKFYMNGDWSNSSKEEFLYSNGKPILGYKETADQFGNYPGTPTSRYLFSFLSGLKNETIGNQIGSLYPNPATDQVLFTVNNAGKDAQYFVYDYTGKLVATDRVTHAEMSIGLAGLANGMYYLNVVSGSTVSSKKFMISK